jgi:uncharacterized OB-fold protein
MMLETVEIGAARAYPPRVSKATEPFWSALAQGRWVTTACCDCGKQSFPPQIICPHCWSESLEWTDLSPRGVIYSWTRVHAAPTVFAAEAPYSVCIVDLDCGIRIPCKLLEGEAAAPSIGMAVEMVRLHYQDGDLFAARAVQR